MLAGMDTVLQLRREGILVPFRYLDELLKIAGEIV